MVKKTAFILLIVLLVLLARESYLTWQESYEEVGVTQEKSKPVTQGKAVQKVNFYPTPPSPLPDLAENYIFNAERHLVTEEEKKNKEAEKKEEKEESKGPEVDMDELIYSGSIIMEQTRKALVSYKEKVENQRRRRPFPGRREPGQKTGERKFALLGVNDTLGSYTVASVESEKIVFQKNGQTIEKMLHDEKVSRIILPSARRSAEPQRQTKSRSEPGDDRDRNERRTVIFSTRPGEKKSDSTDKNEAEEQKRQIRIPFR